MCERTLRMGDVSVTLEAPLDRFVEEQVRSGAYPDAAAVVRAGLDRLREVAEVEDAREARLTALLQEGLDDLDAGRFERVDDVREWLAGRGRPRR